MVGSASNPLRRPIRGDNADGTGLRMAELETARRQARLRLGCAAIMVGHVSVRYGVLPLRFLQMALRSGLKSDGVNSAMLVIGGTITGPQIMVVWSMVLSRRQCNEKRDIINNLSRLRVDPSASELQVTHTTFYLLMSDKVIQHI